MTYRILADCVVVVHFAFVLFVVLEGLLMWRWRWVLWGHLPAAVWGVLVEFAAWTCPLTPLENWLRDKGEATGYTDSFIEYYLVPLLYPTGLTRGFQFMPGVTVLIVNILVYWRAFLGPRRVV